MEEDFTYKETIQDTQPKGPPQPEDIAPLFPQLEMQEILGWGGMGVVYKAKQKSLDRIVAVKILLPKPDRPPAFAERFTREARALASLQHPNIVMVHESGKAGEYYYFTMEYVDGSNLRTLMDSKTLTPEQALAIVPTICDALHYAHEEGIAHRDIKPENILLDAKGRIKIADFGLAKLLTTKQTDYTLTSPAQILGTMHYIAPEQIELSAKVDHRADIYALGVVIYEMLTGELPIGRFPLPSEKSDVDVRLDNIVLHALEKEPDKRYQRVSEIKSDIEAVSAGMSGGNLFSAGAVQPGATSIGVATPAPVAVVEQSSIVREVSNFLHGHKNKNIAYLLWILCFFFIFGIHRMYAGKWITGILWFFTLGLFFIGQFVDLFLIPEMVRQANWESVRDSPEYRQQMIQTLPQQQSDVHDTSHMSRKERRQMRKQARRGY